MDGTSDGMEEGWLDIEGDWLGTELGANDGTKEGSSDTLGVSLG